MVTIYVHTGQALYMCYKIEIAEVENKQKRGWGNKWPLIIITTNEDHWIGVEMLGI